LSRRLLTAIFALAMVALAVPVASAPRQRSAAPAVHRNDYQAYLRDHLRYPAKLRGRQIMSNPAQIPASLIASKQAAQRARAADSGCDGLDKPADGTCTATFWVSQRNASQDYEGQFVLVAKAGHSYIWVDRTAFDPSSGSSQSPVGTVTKDEAQRAADAFERIYAVDTGYFGHEPRPNEKPFRTPPRLPANWRDADGDKHINIVNFPMSAPTPPGLSYVAGYYSSSDEYPVEVNAHSNEGEFFYMNSLMLDVGHDSYNGVLAHEFYHMIQFANDSNEESWVNEGMADIAIEVNEIPGLIEGHMSSFFSEADGNSLTAWGGEVIDYGVAYAFFTYLFDHYGGPDNPKTKFKENYGLAELITKVADDGIDGVAATLAQNPRRGILAPYYRNRTVTDVYQDWSVANYLDDASIGAGQYAYRNIDPGRVPARGSYNTFPSSGTGSMQPYTNHYYVMDSAGDGYAQASGPKLTPIVPNLTGLPSGKFEYWGNRGNQMVTSMTRAADLAGATSPALTFSYWNDIETDWDYAYLEASEDGGKTWKFLVCCEGSSTNPNGNNEAVLEGAGITGQSGVDAPVEQVWSQSGERTDEPSWVAENVDLSSYAGKKILVRFRYVTDPAVTNPGFTVDDISLTDGNRAIWPLDNAEKVNPAWVLDGNTAAKFARITPLVPNQITTQIIKTGPRPAVGRHTAKPSGDQTVARGSADALRAIAVVSSVTPITTESFDYSIKAEASVASGITAAVIAALPSTVAQPYILRWGPASKAGKLAPRSYIVEEQDPSHVRSTLVDDAESGLDKWEAATSNPLFLGWREATDAKHSGSSSFFTMGLEGGETVNNLTNQPFGSSTLTLREPVRLPSAGSVAIEWYDWYFNEPDDFGAVEASSDGGRSWATLGKVFSDGTELPTELLTGKTMKHRSASLDAFRGKDVLLRFAFNFGGINSIDVIPLGWNIDDVKIVATDWREIGTATATSFALSGRPAGLRNYRVTALYTPSLAGPASAAATTRLKAGGVLGGQQGRPGGGLPATGVADASTLGLMALIAAAALRRSLRRALD
jgi:immune inhibitor InhA-like protein